MPSLSGAAAGASPVLFTVNVGAAGAASLTAHAGFSETRPMSNETSAISPTLRIHSRACTCITLPCLVQLDRQTADRDRPDAADVHQVAADFGLRVAAQFGAGR